MSSRYLEIQWFLRAMSLRDVDSRSHLDKNDIKSRGEKENSLLESRKKKIEMMTAKDRTITGTSAFALQKDED